MRAKTNPEYIAMVAVPGLDVYLPFSTYKRLSANDPNLKEKTLKETARKLAEIHTDDSYHPFVESQILKNGLIALGVRNVEKVLSEVETAPIQGERSLW